MEDKENVKEENQESINRAIADEHIMFASRTMNESGIRSIENANKSYYRPANISSAQLSRLLNNPSSNVSALQDVSVKMTQLNGMLKEFINYKSLILTQDHYIYPTDSFKYKDKESIWKDELKVAQYLEKYGIKTLNRWLTKRLLQNGEVYIYKRETRDGIFIQEIPHKICKMFVLDEYGIFRYGVDISKISDKEINYFPEEIANAKARFNTTSDKSKLTDFVGNYYIVSDSGAAFQLNQWENKGLPYYLHLFAGLMNLSDAEALDNLSNKLDNYKLLHHEISKDKDGKMVMGADVVGAYHQAIKSVLPEGIAIVSTPMDLKSIPLGDNKLKTYEHSNNIKKAVYDNAGISDDLFNGNSKTNESTILSSIIDTLVPIEIQGFLEKWFNYELRQKFKKGGWRVKFIETSYYNKQKAIQSERENLAIYGSKKKYLATQGFSPLEALNILHNESLLDLEEYMQPMLTSHTISGDGGRPSNTDNPNSTSISEQGD
jgi:hypothetical protein